MFPQAVSKFALLCSCSKFSIFQNVDTRFFSSSASFLNEEVKTQEETKSEEKPIVNPQDFEKITLENEKFKKSLKETEDKYLRALAEQENMRKIFQQEIQKTKDFAISSFAKILVGEVLDNLESAVKLIKDPKMQEIVNRCNDLKDKAKAEYTKEEIALVAQTFTGVEMTNDILYETLRKFEISEIEDPLNQTFDAKLHDAVMKIPCDESKGQKPNQVVSVLKKGFMIKSRVLRPTQVVVSTKKQ